MRTPLRYRDSGSRSGRRRGGDRSPRPPQQPIQTRPCPNAPALAATRASAPRRPNARRQAMFNSMPLPRRTRIRLPMGRRVLRTRADHGRRGLGQPRHGWRRPPLAQSLFLGPSRRPTMRTRTRYLTTLLAAAGACAAIAVGARRSRRARMHEHRAQHDPVPEQRQRPDRHLAPGEQQLRRTGASRSSDSAAGASVGDPGLATARLFRLT